MFNLKSRLHPYVVRWLSYALVATLFTAIGPVSNSLAAPAAQDSISTLTQASDKSITTETGIKVARNSTINDPFTMGFGSEANFAIYIELVNPAAGQYLQMNTTFTNTNDFFGGSSSNFTKGIFIGTNAEFKATFPAGSNKLKLVTGSAANTNTTIRWKAAVWDSTYYYYSTNHHFYKMVAVASKTVTQALSDANGAFMGNNGYLATLTTSGENDAAQAAGSAANITSGSYWIGASDKDKEGVWRWSSFNTSVDGDKAFFLETCVGGSATSIPSSSGCSDTNSHSPAGGVNYTSDGLNYSNWSTNEPNNAFSVSGNGVGEDYATIIMDSGSRGKWNDLYATNPPNGYLVEWGSTTSDFAPMDYSEKAITSPVVIFNANGGTGTFTAQSSLTNTTLKTFSTGDEFTNSAGPLAGWTTTADSTTGTWYDPGATYPFSSLTTDQTLYAQWLTSPSANRSLTYTVGSNAAVTSANSMDLTEIYITSGQSLQISSNATKTLSKFGLKYTWRYRDPLNDSNTQDLPQTYLNPTYSSDSSTITFSNITTNNNLFWITNQVQQTYLSQNSPGAIAHSLRLNVSAALAFTSTPGQANFVLNTQGAYSPPTFTGGRAPYSYNTAPGDVIPPGLWLNNSTGLLAGTPTVSGTTSLHYVITDANGQSITSSAYNVVVPLNVSISSPITGYYKTPLTISAPTVTGETPTAYSISPTLPTGLSLNASTGVISGTPTVLSSATTYTETATKTSVGASGSTTFVLTIGKALANVVLTTDSATPVYGSTITLTSRLTTASGETTTGTVVIKDASNNTICTTGSISAGLASCTYPISSMGPWTLRAEYGGSTYFETSTSSTITVTPVKANQSSIAISVPNVKLTKNKGTALSITGGTVSGGTVTWSTSTGTCSFAGSTETITSTSTTSCVVTATLSGSSIYNSISTSMTIEVVDSPSISITPISSITYGSNDYSFSVPVTNGLTPFTWNVVKKSSGETVTGLTLVAASSTSGTLVVGRYTPAGLETYTATVTDLNGATYSKDFTIDISKKLPTFTVTPTGDTATTITKTISLTVSSNDNAISGTVSLSAVTSPTTSILLGCQNLTLVNGSASCIWTTDKAFPRTWLEVKYSGDTNYLSAGLGAEAAARQTNTYVQVNDYVMAYYQSLTKPYGEVSTFKPNSITGGTGPTSSWTWDVVKTSDSSTISGFSMVNETLTVGSTVALGTYNLTIRVTDAKSVMSYIPITLTVNKASATFSVSADTATTTVGKNITFTITALKPNTTGTINLYAGDTTNTLTNCVNISLSSGVATCTYTSSSAVGPNTVYIGYSGDTNYNVFARISSTQSYQFYPHNVMIYANLTTPYGTAASTKGTFSVTGGGAANLWTWTIVKKSDSSTVSGISMNSETITVSSAVNAGTYLMQVRTVDGLGDYTTTDVTITVTPLTGLTATLGSPTRIANGFTVNVTNYDANYTFNASATPGLTVTAGTPSGSTLTFTVSGMADSASAWIQILTTRTNYTDVYSNSVTGYSLMAGIAPSLTVTSKTSTGFVVTLSNWNSGYTWSESVTAGTVTPGVGSGSIRTYTITGLTIGQSSTLSVWDTSTTSKLTSASITGTTLANQAAITITKTTGTYKSETLTATGGSGTGALTFQLASAGSPGTAVCSISGVVISAQSAGTCNIVAIRAADSDYLTETSTSTVFTFSAASGLSVKAVAGSVNYAVTSNYTASSVISGGLVGTDTGTVTSATYTYLGISGTSYTSSTTKPTAVGTYSVTPSAATISLSSGFVAGYATPYTYASDTLTVVATVPGTPNAPVATVLSATSISITITQPTNTGGVTITSYLITNMTDNSTVSTSNLTQTITGLNPGTAYTFKVQAINSVGSSDTSAASTSVTTKLLLALQYTAIGLPYGNTLPNNTPTVTGGPATSFSVSPALPTGISLNTSTGVISGTANGSLGSASYVITATKTGTPTITGSDTLTITITKVSTTVTLTASSSSPSLGSAITYTATVAPANGSSVQTGTVTFYKDSSVMCSIVSLSAAVATCSNTPSIATAFSVYAVYNGDSYSDTSTSSTLSISPSKGNPTISLTASAAYFTLGSSTTLSAQLAYVSGIVPTGSIGFALNGTDLTSCSAKSITTGLSTCSWTPTATGTFPIVATYTGDSNYNGVVSSSYNITISKCDQNSSGVTLETGTPTYGYCAVQIKSGSGTWSLPTNVISMTATVMVIGGGGAGGSRHGGGGGAGSLLLGSNVPLSNSMTATIGAGGTGGTTSTNAPTANSVGGDTTFGTTIAAGGGSGGGASRGTGASGGSGGGGAGSSAGASGAQTTQSNFTTYVNAGKTGTSGSSEPNWSGGGGGGAGGDGTPGTSGNPATPGNGGAGIASNLTLNGDYACFAGGGGGGQVASSGLSNGGRSSGGGCTGLVVATVGGAGNKGDGNANDATSGTANTGSGGGGGGFSGGTNYATGNGGSGLISFRYISPASITVSPDTSTVSLATVTFVAVSTTFTGLLARTFQWQKSVNGGTTWTDESGATSLTYTFTAHWNNVTTQKYRLVITDTDGTLITKTASPVITLTVTAATQAALSVATNYAAAGTSITLSTSGGSGTGAVTYASVATGSASGCTLASGVLSISGGAAGSCKVVATKAADIDYLVKSSDTATVTFITYQVATQAVPSNPTTGITVAQGNSADTSRTNAVPEITQSTSWAGAKNSTFTLTGTGFTGITIVKFNRNQLATFSVVDDTHISVTVPNGATTGNLVISKPDSSRAGMTLQATTWFTVS